MLQTKLNTVKMKRIITITLLSLMVMAVGLTQKKSTKDVTQEGGSTSNYQNLEVKYNLSFFKPY